MNFGMTSRFGRSLVLLGPGLAALALSNCTSVFPSPSPAAEGHPQGVVGPRVRQEVSGVPLPAGERVDIWLVADPLHTGVVLPLDWLKESGFVVPRKVRGAKYVNLSWGDRVAYEEERWLTPTEVVQALFLPSESVMEIVAVDYDPRWVFPAQRLYRGSVSRGCGPAAAAFLNHCVKPNPDGPGLEVIGEATWGTGALLGCPHSYQFPRLCNSWTAGALTSCGYSSGLWSRLTANSMIRSMCRQGFEPVPELTSLEREALAHYLETGEVTADAP